MFKFYRYVQDVTFQNRPNFSHSTFALPYFLEPEFSNQFRPNLSALDIQAQRNRQLQGSVSNQDLNRRDLWGHYLLQDPHFPMFAEQNRN